MIAVVYLALLLLPIGAVHFWRKRQESKRRSPLNQMLLRGPGESLRNELDDAYIEMVIYVVMLPMLPLLIFALHLSQSYFGGAKETAFRTSIDILAALAAIAFFLFKIKVLLDCISNFRLGYEGEVAIAQELNQLMRNGAYVFHDFPAEDFNIDHVIVLPGGVFAVETKGRMKPKRNRGKYDAKVVFDGMCLQFPGWTETEPLDQTMRQAKWLSQWLSSAVGDAVGVKPVLALPGWFVDLHAKSDIVIVNGRGVSSIFSKMPHSPLEEEMIRRIAHQLEQRCRDVKPRNFGRRKRISSNV